MTNNLYSIVPWRHFTDFFDLRRLKLFSSQVHLKWITRFEKIRISFKTFLKMDHSILFSKNNSWHKINVLYKNSGFEPRTSGVGSYRSVNWATTTAHLASYFMETSSELCPILKSLVYISKGFTYKKWSHDQETIVYNFSHH